MPDPSPTWVPSSPQTTQSILYPLVGFLYAAATPPVAFQMAIVKSPFPLANRGKVAQAAA